MEVPVEEFDVFREAACLFCRDTVFSTIYLWNGMGIDKMSLPQSDEKPGFRFLYICDNAAFCNACMATGPQDQEAPFKCISCQKDACTKGCTNARDKDYGLCDACFGETLGKDYPMLLSFDAQFLAATPIDVLFQETFVDEPPTDDELPN